MELTKKATEEIQKLQAKLVQLERDRTAIQNQMKSTAASDYSIYHALQKEVRRLQDKHYKIEQQIKGIEASGISNSEEKALLREASSVMSSKFVTIQRSKSLGCTDYVKVGWSKSVAGFVKVSYAHYNGFMRNVQGCSSLADKKRFGSFTRLTELEVDELLKAGRKVETNFLGHEERVIPIERSAADLRA